MKNATQRFSKEEAEKHEEKCNFGASEKAPRYEVGESYQSLTKYCTECGENLPSSAKILFEL